MAKVFTITVSGKSESDVQTALEEVLRYLKEGFLSGGNSQDYDNYYHFDSTGEYQDDSEGG